MDDALLDSIVNHLILQSPSLDNVGLLDGKMGVVLFFAHYARYAKSDVSEEYADELLSQVMDNLSSDLPINMSYGLCGIGWGIEYLLQNHFMEGSGDDILEELDCKIMERDLRRITDCSFETGLAGISCYIDMRLRGTHQSGYMPFDSIYLQDWNVAKAKNSIPDEFCSLLSMITFTPNSVDVENWRVGLKDGCAGYGLRMLLK